MLSDMITKRAVADDMDVTIRTVERWIKDGTLKAYKIGRQVRVKREDLEAAFTPVGDAA